MSIWSMQGKVAIVTGAASGIGASIAKKFATAGARVVLADINETAVISVQGDLANTDEHRVCPGDLGSVDECRNLIEYTLAEFNKVDVLVNAAAYLHRVSLSEVGVEYWERTVAINMAAPLFLVQACVESMKEQKSGRIILFSSQAAFTGGFHGSTVYAMTKAAVVALVKSLAREMAPYGVCVNSIAPGAVDTPMLRGGMSERAMEEFVTKIPAGRLGTPDELADVCHFLASDASSYITGQTLDVNGGQLMR